VSCDGRGGRLGRLLEVVLIIIELLCFLSVLEIGRLGGLGDGCSVPSRQRREVGGQERLFHVVTDL